jgi:hypothetical protein
LSIAPRLIVRLHNWIGDVIVGLPVLQLLESRGVAFEAVGRPWAASLLAGHGWTIHTRPDALRERVQQMRTLGRRLSPNRLQVDGKPIDALLADAQAGRAYFKVYRQFKMYNDPRFNPVLVAEQRAAAKR